MTLCYRSPSTPHPLAPGAVRGPADSHVREVIYSWPIPAEYGHAVNSAAKTSSDCDRTKKCGKGEKTNDRDDIKTFCVRQDARGSNLNVAREDTCRKGCKASFLFVCFSYFVVCFSLPTAAVRVGAQFSRAGGRGGPRAARGAPGCSISLAALLGAHLLASLKRVQPPWEARCGRSARACTSQGAGRGGRGGEPSTRTG